MIRFVDIATDAKPKKASAPTSDGKAAMPVAAAAEATNALNTLPGASTTSTNMRSTETPRKPKRTS